MVTFTRLTNQRLRTNRQEHLQSGKECACLSRCNHAAASFFPVVYSFSPLSSSLLSSFLSSPSRPFCMYLFAFSLSPYGSCLLFRSRTRCQNRNHQRRRQHRDTWHDVPPVRHPRRVLIIVNLEAVRPLMTAVHDDAMDSTTCESSPSLGRMEGTCSVHLQRPDPSISRGNPHGEQFAVLHQPTHPVHLGSSS